MEIKELVQRQRAYYQKGNTRSLIKRKQALQRLQACIKRNETAIHEALYEDLHKATMESYMSETGMVLAELRMQLRHFEQNLKKCVHLLPNFPLKAFNLQNLME